ncbi:MAG: ferrochelatase [Deltaproteobacteria bacterium]|nr:ferrochelatase [Deltaproteobacteria bacterium]
MTGVLLINLGTPDEPTVPAVRRYLKEFLSDPYVIDINPLARWLLVNCVISPFRAPKSTLAYRKVWTDRGSPLLFYTVDLTKKVAEKLGNGFVVEMAMRYGRPSIEEGMKKLIQKGVSEIRVLPLYPQYASSSTGSTIDEVNRLAKKMNSPPFKILPAFYNHPGFVKSFAEIGMPILNDLKPHHVLFSFHGLPERHILKGDPYRDHSFHTAHAIAKVLGLKPDEYSVSFQSRLGRTPWIKPYTDLILVELAQKGKKKVAVFCPSFVADCLETLEEIGIRGRESFLAAGGEKLELIPSLNTHPMWVEAVCGLVSTPAQAG